MFAYECLYHNVFKINVGSRTFCEDSWRSKVDISELVSVSQTFKQNYVKAAPWDDINFRFQFRTEVVYPTDHVFIFFRIFIFLQIFLINISMKP